MAKVIGIAIQKGGAGKSTTTFELASILAEEYNRRVLVADVDPQATLTHFCQQAPYSTAYDLLRGQPWQPVRPRGFSFDLIPSSIDLAEAELVLTKHPTWGLLLKEGLTPVLDSYDYILLDAPPSLGLLTSNVILAAAGLIIPVQTEEEAARGMGLLLATMNNITRTPPPVIAVVPTRYNAQSVYHRAVLDNLRSTYGALVTDPVKQSVRFPESTTMHQPITHYEPELAAPYRNLAARVESWAQHG